MSEEFTKADKVVDASCSGNFLYKSKQYKYDWGDTVYYYEEDWCEFEPAKLKVITYFGKYGEPDTYLCANEKGVVYFLAETELKTEEEVKVPACQRGKT